jgi:hypothetical protein
MTLYYGVSQNNLNKNISFTNYSTSQIFALEDLLPNTQYFFQIKTTDSQGKTIVSDIFTFTTSIAPPAEIAENSIVVVSKNNVIYDQVSPGTSGKLDNYIVIPTNTNFQFKFSFKTNQIIRKAKIIVRKKANAKVKRQVLGINNFAKEAEAATNNVSLIEIKPGVFTATVKSSIEPGNYDLLVSFEDENGNLSEQQLANIRVTQPFTVVEKNNLDQPIEGARVFLSVYSSTQRLYVPLSSSGLNINNPLFTDHHGFVDFVLPKGKYKVNVTNLGYKEKTVEFSIEDSDQTNYPIITLEKDSFNVITFANYFYNGFNDVFLSTTALYFSYLNVSLRFFDLIAASILLSFVAITLFAFSKKHHIPL